MKSKFNQIKDYLSQAGYDTIPTDSNTVQMFAYMEESTLYLVNVIALSQEHQLEPSGYNQYRQLIQRQFKPFGAEKILLLNMILTDTPERIYDSIHQLNSRTADFEDLHWFVDTRHDVLMIPRGQRDDFLELEKALPKVIDHGLESRYVLYAFERSPYISAFLVTLMLVVFIVMLVIPGTFARQGWVSFGGLTAEHGFEQGEWYRFFTYWLIHATPLHILISTSYIFFFGRRLEQIFKRLDVLMITLAVLLFSGAFAFAMHVIQKQSGIILGGTGIAYGYMGSLLVGSVLSKRPIKGVDHYGMLLLFLFGVFLALIQDPVDILLPIGGFLSGTIVATLIMRHYRYKRGFITYKK